MPHVRVLPDVLTDGWRLHDIEWETWGEPGREGVERHVLWAPTDDDGSVGLLLRFVPGAHGDFHKHLGIELMLVLDGVLDHSDGRRFGRGALIVESPGTRHQMSSTTGCTVLAVRTKPALTRLPEATDLAATGYASLAR